MSQIQDQKIFENIAKRVHLETPVTIDGQEGIIVHNRLLSDGPVHPVTREPLIDPKTGYPYEGENDDVAFVLEKQVQTIRGNITIGGGSDKTIVPRYGVLSLVAGNTPIYLYDHPALKKVSNTAFTDGLHVFVDADFARKLIQQEAEQRKRNESTRSEHGMTFLILHELMHKLLCHVDRLKNYPKDIANIAEDYVINGKLVASFNMRPVPLLQEYGVGMKPEDAEKYSTMAEEIIAEQLMLQRRKMEMKSSKGNPNKDGPKMPGKGSGGSGDEDEGDSPNNDEEENNNPSSSSSKKKKQGSGKPTDDDGNKYSNNHHITPEELIEILKENGLMETAGKALGLPDDPDSEELQRKVNQSRLNDTESLQRAIAQAQMCNGQYPGKNTAGEIAQTIEGLNKGKITWKLQIQQEILGNGMRLRDSDDEAAITWYLDKNTMGVDPFYLGALVPAAPDEVVLCLIDTSGSTSDRNNHMRREFLSEVLSLKRGVSTMGDTAREVVVMSADTVLLGEPLIITEANAEQFLHKGIQINDGGGTDLAACLKASLDLPIMKKKKIKSVLYFTDCEDYPPQRKDFQEYLDKGMKIVFVTTPGKYNERWNHEVGFAEVVCIEEGAVADLSNEGKSSRAPSRRRRSGP